jgi:protein SCO1/2
MAEHSTLEVTVIARRSLLAVLLAPALACARRQPLPVIGDAPAVVRVDQGGRTLSLPDLRGKVLALSFVFTTCSDTCPIVTAKMVDLQRRLGEEFGRRVHFVSISVDPLTDTPERLRAYAAKFDANTRGWSFLTGTPRQIENVVRRFGAYAGRAELGAVDHLNLTSLVDSQGRLRVQYLGYRFQVDEMLADLQALLRE